ncbi:MAG: trans-aconitate 2-methyltransferase [Kofleriaceae bacterium]
MRQKVALTAAHLLCRGRIADMGMGSGAGSEALAALYPELEVVGVDVDPVMVERARARYPLPNLTFREGDIARPVFEPGSLDGIFNSSVLHHVTTFSGYDHHAAARALAVQVAQLRPHGVLVVRDFLDPGPGDVLLDVPDSDGDGSDDPITASTAGLFERFAREFRSLSTQPGFAFERCDGAMPGWRRYRVSHKLAVEFVLRKDYREDWASEVKEEYTFFDQRGFEAVFAALGLRLLASTPIRNPWIVRHRLAGKIALRSLDGNPLELPATNYVITGERVAPDEGVVLRAGQSRAPLGFLAMEHYRNRATGQVYDLVRRPHVTLDILPWFEHGTDVFVVARMAYPRPILSIGAGDGSLDGGRAPLYVTEPLNALQVDRPVGQTIEDALVARAAIRPDQIRGFRGGANYCPSPGGIAEQVRSMLVEIDPVFVEQPLENVSGFHRSGRVRAIEARQLLRAAQVGGVPDARIELNVYELLLAQGRDLGPWIGDQLELDEVVASEVTSMMELANRPARRRFVRADPTDSPRFLRLECTWFEELDAAGRIIAARPLEYVVPDPRGIQTIATALLRRTAAGIQLGIDDDDLPAAQAFDGNSNLLVAPAWRLPHHLTSLTPARDFVLARLAEEYGVSCGRSYELGGRYHPSPGVTPEVVYPMAFEVLNEQPSVRQLAWVPLADVVAHRSLITDGHLRIVALRAAHALEV